jgi:lipopolysaccharide transport system ATP-binding protein
LHRTTASPSLRALGIGKCYSLSRSRVRPLLRHLLRPRSADQRPDVFWAVRDASFDVAQGESVGLIGRNGAGKSTLLRLLAGVARPTAGRIEVGARLGCLLDLGVGFHALETGRQNTETVLRLLGGLGAREARQAAHEVAAFADIGDFFDAPLRSYSTGMQLRVAFAAATFLKPELLITDEILSVGDAAFQAKCSRWFDRFIADGGSLVLCSHDLSQVERLCGRAIWLESGEVRDGGPSREVIAAYRSHVGETDRRTWRPPDAGVAHGVGEQTSLGFEVVDLHLFDVQGNEVRALPLDATLVVQADVSAPEAVPHIGIGITREDGAPVYGVTSDMDGARPIALGGGRYRFRLTFPDLPLEPGRYALRSHALDETATRLYDTVEIFFEVEGDSRRRPLVRIPGEWQ